MGDIDPVLHNPDKYRLNYTGSRRVYEHYRPVYSDTLEYINSIPVKVREINVTENT